MSVQRRRYRFKVQYDGGAFSGWQVQPARRTVQGELETALGALLREKIIVWGAGRTDSGVHALGQVGHFISERDPDCALLQHKLNGFLGQDVSVRDVKPASPHFHARHSATGRVYRYHLAFRKSPLMRARSWYTPGGMDEAVLRAQTRKILGRHDFRGFCARSDRHEGTLCHLRRAQWRRWEDGLYLELEADRFLHHMVRNLVGTLVPVARGRWLGPDIRELLRLEDRRLAGPTAPARGLCLMHVHYRSRPGRPARAGGSPGKTQARTPR